jgi:hypothetical protein
VNTKLFATIVVPILFALGVHYTLTLVFGARIGPSFLFAVAVGVLLHFGAARLYQDHFLWEEEDEIPLPPPKVKRFWVSLFNLCFFSCIPAAIAWLVIQGTVFGPVMSIAIGALTYRLLLPLFGPGDVPQRGRERITSREARQRGEASLAAAAEGLSLGRVRLPDFVACTGLLFIGAIGTGKSLLIKLLGKSVFPFIGKTHEGKKPADGEQPRDLRAVVFDAKQDTMSYLHRVADAKIVTLNPFDLRCGFWNLSRDINEPIFAEALAYILIPVNPNAHQPYFDDAPRELLQAVPETFIELKIPDWSLFDLIHACTNQARLEKVLEKTARGRDLIQNHLRAGEASLNVMSTLLTKAGRYRFVAYAWDHARATGGKDKEVCLHDFVHGAPCILVLGNSKKAKPSVQAINQLIMKRLGDIILELPDSLNRKIWFFIDEARMAGKFEGLSELVVEGRSKGVCPVLGFQDLDGFFHVYGEKEGNELIGQFSNRCILGLRSQRTAEWASKLFGEYEGFEFHESTTSNSSGTGTTTSYQLAKRQGFLTSQFDLPQTGPKNGLHGYYLVPHIDGAYKDKIPWEFIEREILSLGKPRDGADNVPDFVPRPVEHQYARAWTKDDLDRLGIKLDADEEKEAGKRLKAWQQANHTPNRKAEVGGDDPSGKDPKTKKNRLKVRRVK